MFFGLMFFALATVTYFLLRFFAEKYYIADVLKDAFLAVFGVVFISATFFLIFSIGDGFLNLYYPNRIFTKNFGFDPTADVRIINGSGFWSPFGYLSHLKFQANKNTIEKISANDFPELTGSFIKRDGSTESKEILAQPQSHYYQKRKSIDDVNSAYLVYDEQSQTAYFSLQSDD